MTELRVPSPPLQRLKWCAGMAVLALLGGCTTVGPDFERPEADAPADWTEWHGGDARLRIPAETQALLPADWWRLFDDPVLDELQARAFSASPDLESATLRFAQARVQRQTVAAQRAPEVGASAGVSRNRLSEYGAGTRLIDAIVDDRQPIIDILSEPFNLYQAGFDASWEIDFWGRIARSVEVADADVAQQAALLDLARLVLASEVARNYFELRTTQQQLRLAREDVDALGGRVELLAAQVDAGLIDALDLERQRAELAAVEATLPALLARESASANQLALLLGERPGAFNDLLRAPDADAVATLPDLALGLPSEVALRRPDIRAAEARLHGATAGIGVARAQLYPSIRIGAHFGMESYLSDEFFDWGSRAWSIGPSLDLPLFDNGRRQSVVQLRELQQQEAAVAYQQTVLKAWQEIDDALTAYAAEQQQASALVHREERSREAFELARAQYDAGLVPFTVVLDSHRGYLLARRDLVSSEGRLYTRFVMVNKAIGNAPRDGGMVSDA